MKIDSSALWHINHKVLNITTYFKRVAIRGVRMHRY